MGESQSKQQRVDLKKQQEYDPDVFLNSDTNVPFKELDFNEQAYFVNEILKQKFNDSSKNGKNILQFLREKGYSLTNQILGQGGFGLVVKGYSHKLKGYVAVKIVKFKSRKQFFDNLLEFNNQQDLKHVNIICSEEIINLNELQMQFIVMELCKTDLIGYLNYQLSQKKWISKNEILQIWYQLIQGLKYLHSKNIIHLDIKPANILLGMDNQWKYNDFGLSQVLHDGQQSTTDTVLNYLFFLSNTDLFFNLFLKKGFTQTYCSPEQYYHHFFKIQQNITKESDIYSLGLVFLVATQVILSRTTLIKIKLEEKLIPQYLNPSYENLNQKVILQMLKGKPENRISLQEIEYLVMEYLDNGGIFQNKYYNSRNRSVPNLNLNKKTLSLEKETLRNSSQVQIEKSIIYNPSKRVLTNRETSYDKLELRQKISTPNQTPIRSRKQNFYNSKEQLLFKSKPSIELSPEKQIDLLQLGAENKVPILPLINEKRISNNNNNTNNTRGIGYLFYDNPVNDTQQKDQFQLNTEKIHIISNQNEGKNTQTGNNLMKDRYINLQSKRQISKSSRLREGMNFLPNIYQNNNRSQLNLIVVNNNPNKFS